jgi:hypothetical protein
MLFGGNICHNGDKREDAQKKRRKANGLNKMIKVILTTLYN